MTSRRTLLALSRMCNLCNQIASVRRSYSTKIGTCDAVLAFNFKPQIITPVRNLSVSEDPSINLSDYPTEVEVSHEEFKYVEQVLPPTTVPKIPQHSSYPTPSGWVPPNDDIRSQQPYLVRRTKNHVLPIYPEQKEVWGRMMHHVTIRNIEGDIWKLESELRHHLKQNMAEEAKVISQVHEVSRCIRIRGQHRATIAEFLLEKGM